MLELRNINAHYGHSQVLYDISLDVKQGEFVTIIGANGAGKSTLLRLLAHILRPTTGFITLYGQPLNEFKDWQKIGYVPQNPGRQQRSFPISVREVVALGRLDGRSLLQRFNDQDEAAVAKIIEQFSLQDLARRKIGDLSGGQQQRVFLARAMVNNPDLLLLDEPATGVDPDAKVELYQMLGNLNQREGKTIVMVSHDLELASQYAHDALCLDRSVCFWGGVHEALTHRHKHGYFYR